MQTNKPVKLIEGVFTPAEAKEILLNLLNHKLNFHNMKNFSVAERFGTPHAASVKRIEELKKAKEEVLSIVMEAEKNENNLTIESGIHITPVPQEKTATVLPS